ncbi:hypothetical protein MML48_1g00154 [Holotrichia oblita]|uniref:Uncharacterized protein n=1 Tax=Holotrichia oblita TaxID=644536 RepID=A0ACB9TRP0_HOLOL|nr:hypothetical protein MML48_1g00154 [Holotrichia oblita]
MIPSRGQKIVQMTMQPLTQANKCNEIFEKQVITSLSIEEGAFVADNTQSNIIEGAEIVMEIYPTTSSMQDVPHKNLKILATGCANAAGNVILLNNVYCTEPEESSDSNELEEKEDEETVVIRESKGKKRKRNSDKWKKNIIKQKRAAGVEYMSANNKLIGKKGMKAPCHGQCQKKCTHNISVESRALIHSQFWNGSIQVD